MPGFVAVPPHPNWIVPLSLRAFNRFEPHIEVVTLAVEKRKPFDFLAERPFLKNGRGNRS
jgi:hypothetical protein